MVPKICGTLSSLTSLWNCRLRIAMTNVQCMTLGTTTQLRMIDGRSDNYIINFSHKVITNQQKDHFFTCTILNKHHCFCSYIKWDNKIDAHLVVTYAIAIINTWLTEIVLCTYPLNHWGCQLCCPNSITHVTKLNLYFT